MLPSVRLPKAVVGIVIAAVVLLPELLAALRAARANRLQTSPDLALGSILSAIGLTVPAVALVSLVLGQLIALRLDDKDQNPAGAHAYRQRDHAGYRPDHCPSGHRIAKSIYPMRTSPRDRPQLPVFAQQCGSSATVHGALS